MAKLPNFVKFPYIPPSPPHYFPPWPNVPPPPNNNQSPPRPVPPHPPRPNVPPPPNNHPSPPTTPPRGAPSPRSPAVKPPPPPPPPHIVPIPPHHHTVIIIVFGGFFFLAFMAAVIFCCVKNKKKRIVKEADKYKIEEHVKVREEIMGGPHGTQTVVLTIDEDVQIEEEIIKSSATEVKPKSSHHLKSDQLNSQPNLGIAELASTSNHHR